MKITKNNYVIVGIVISLTVVLSWSIVGFTKSVNNELTFTGSTNKESFLLGEPISVTFTVSNKGKLPEKVHSAGVETGFLKIFIRRDNEEYKQYFGYGWGLIIGRMTKLAPGETITYKPASILWNGRPDVSHLNSSAATEALKGRITTDYAFPEPGIYFIKGVSYVGENATSIESEPIRIEIKNPEGNDLEVWKQIKSNREIALLLQNGTFDTEDKTRKGQLSDQVEQILTQFPNSIYSNYLKPSLDKFRVSEAQRQEFMQKMQKQRPQ